jgi:hypothetical protein
MCRRGAVTQAVLLHLLSVALAPTLQAFDHFVLEGHLPEPHDHVCIRFDASVHPHAPRFWATAAWVPTAQGAECVPKCLEDVVAHVVAAGKSVALLRAHRQTSDEIADNLAGTQAAERMVPRHILLHACMQSKLVRTSMRAQRVSASRYNVLQLRLAQGASKLLSGSVLVP